MAPLDPDLLLRAYSIGVFPMSDGRDARDVFWVEPRKRAIIPLGGFRLSRSLRKTIRADIFRVTRDTAFTAVPAALRGSERDLDQRADRASFNIHSSATPIRSNAGGEDWSAPLWREARRRFFGESMFSLHRTLQKSARLARRRLGSAGSAARLPVHDRPSASLGASRSRRRTMSAFLDCLVDGAAAARRFRRLDRLLAPTSRRPATPPPDASSRSSWARRRRPDARRR
jgi:leucyl/phenylalanyl-tRNA--protein transferase